MASMRKKVVTRRINARGKRCRPGEECVRTETEESSKWYAFGVPGSPAPTPLATSKRVAEQMLAELIRDGESAAAGLPTSVERSKTVPTLIADYHTHLTAQGCVERHAAQVREKLLRLAGDLAWRSPHQLLADRVTDWLHRLTTREQLSPQTRNHYLVTLRAFVRWLSRPPRRLLLGDVLDLVPHLPVSVDQRRARRALTPTELSRLLTATLDSSRVLRGLSPRQRHLMYVVAATTGLRSAEIGSLSVDSLDLDSESPCILLAAARGKNRRPARQPLPRAVVPLILTHVSGMLPEATLWPGGWDGHAAEFLRADLERAGVPYIVSGPDGPLHADFHSLRHTYVAHLEIAGVSLRDAMQLARHSDPRLTLARYGRSQAEALGKIVDTLPGIGCLPGCPSIGRDVAGSDADGEDVKKKRAA